MRAKILGTIGILLFIASAGFVYSNFALSTICMASFGIVMDSAVKEWRKEYAESDD